MTLLPPFQCQKPMTVCRELYIWRWPPFRNDSVFSCARNWQLDNASRRLNPRRQKSCTELRFLSILGIGLLILFRTVIKHQCQSQMVYASVPLWQCMVVYHFLAIQRLFALDYVTALLHVALVGDLKIYPILSLEDLQIIEFDIKYPLGCKKAEKIQVYECSCVISVERQLTKHSLFYHGYCQSNSIRLRKWTPRTRTTLIEA